MSYNRIVRVEFLTADGKLKSLEGIDVRFSVDLPASAVMVDASISICNLNRDDLAYLTTFTSQWLAMTKRKRIRLYAGYSDTQVGMIFDGDIYNAIPTDPPDIWMDCTARSGNYESTQVFTQSVFSPTPIKSIFETAAGNMGLAPEWRSTSAKKISKYSFSGNNTAYIDALTKLDDILVFEENGNLVCVDKFAPVRDGKIRLISEKTGMVGIPKIDYIGIEAKMFLDTRIRRGDTVQLESNRMPSANGLYYVYHINHEGQLRGQNFYTTIKARRLDAYGKELKLA